MGRGFAKSHQRHLRSRWDFEDSSHPTKQQHRGPPERRVGRCVSGDDERRNRIRPDDPPLRARRDRRHGRPVPRGRRRPRPVLDQRRGRRRLLVRGAARPLGPPAGPLPRPPHRQPGHRLLDPRLLPRPVRARPRRARHRPRPRRRTRPAVPSGARRRQPGVAVREDRPDRPLPRRRRARQHLPADRPGQRPVPRVPGREVAPTGLETCATRPRLGIRGTGLQTCAPHEPAQPVRRRAARGRAGEGPRPRRRQLHPRRRVRLVALRAQARRRRAARRAGRRHARRRRQRVGLALHADGVRPTAGALAVGPVLAVRREGRRPDGRRGGRRLRAQAALRRGRARRHDPRRDRRGRAVERHAREPARPREGGPAPGDAKGLRTGRVEAARRGPDRVPRDRDAGRRRGRVREPARAVGRGRLGCGSVRDRVGEIDRRPPADRGRGRGRGEGAPGDGRGGAAAGGELRDARGRAELRGRPVPGARQSGAVGPAGGPGAAAGGGQRVRVRRRQRPPASGRVDRTRGGPPRGGARRLRETAAGRGGRDGGALRAVDGPAGVSGAGARRRRRRARPEAQRLGAERRAVSPGVLHRGAELPDRPVPHSAEGAGGDAPATTADAPGRGRGAGRLPGEPRA